MAKAKAKSKTAKTQSQPIVSYKGFDPDFKCRDHQFEVGKTYSHNGPVKCCPGASDLDRGAGGFHACENPLDVLTYYELIAPDGRLNRFGRVEQSGEIDRHSEDTKIASAEITIRAELKLPEFIGAAVKWVLGSVKGASGERVQSASGYYSQLAASGYYSQLAASGNSSQLAASGNSSQLAASGNSSQLAASGYSSRLAASGNSSQLAASGYHSQLAASGNSSRLAASGRFSQLAASGYYSQLAASGKDSVIASAAPGCIASAAVGTWIALPEFRGGKCIGFATGCIGKDGLKPDTPYRAEGGKLVEVGE